MLGKCALAGQTKGMKVTRTTHDQLIVEDRPLLITVVLSTLFLGTLAGAISALSAGEIAVAFFFACFTAFVGLFIFVFVRRVQLIFDRPQNTVTFRKRSLLRHRETVRALDELSHAITEGFDTKRSVLVFATGMSEGHHPVTDYSTSGPRPKRITDTINAWLKDTAAVDSKGSNT